MKKRIVCVLLTLIMLVGMIPATALTAFAASNLSVSEAAIKLIKEFEGFSKTAYWDNSQYSIGYGSACQKDEYPDGIDEKKADELLRAELKEVDKAINSFASTKKLTFTQAQHDALASFSYNCGTAWMNADGRFRQSVIDGDTGNAFLYNICLWANVGTEPSAGLLKRRLCEANLYLNGQYSATPPSNYTYVILNANGGSVGEDKMHGYNANVPVAIQAVPTYKDHQFMGWYTAKDGGSYVTVLDSSTAGKTLYAHWQAEGGGKDKDGNIVGTAASYSISGAQLASLTVYKTPSTSAQKTGTVKKTDTLNVVAEYIDKDNVKWVQLKDGGWVSLGDVEDPIVLLTNVTVTVTGTYINVREKAGATADIAIVGKVNQGDKLTISQVTTVNGSLWGRFEKGWVALMYTDYDEIIESAGAESTEVIATGTVVCSSYVNVRSSAGVTGAQVGKVANGTKVNIYEIKDVNGHDWGRISSGWICLDYVTLDSDTPDKDTEKDPDSGSQTVTIVSAIVKSDIDSLNVVAEPGSSTVLEVLKSGTKATIYDVKTVDGKTWGEVSNGEITGWIDLAYVDLVEEELTIVSTKSGVVANADKVNVRSAAGVSNAVVATLTRGTKVTIYEQVTVNNAPWARIDKGWICMYYVELDSESSGGSTSPEGAVGTGVVNSNTNLNVRSGPGMNYNKVASLPKGTKVTIYEKTTTNGVAWGKIDQGWVCLSYVTITSSSSDGINGDGVMGTVVNCSPGVNIRSAAGVHNALVGKAAVGSRVKVYEQVLFNGVYWGRIDKGWVCMNYIKLDSSLPDTPDSSTGSTPPPEGAIGTGVVNSNVDLNVRTGPGTSYAKVTSLKKGTTVTVYEQQLKDGMIWGRIDQGWVCMSYVTMVSTNITGTGVMGTIARCARAVNVRSAPGVGNALVGTILVGSRVEIYEQVTYNGADWGRVAQGWISMQYVLLDSELPPAPDMGTGTETDTDTDKDADADADKDTEASSNPEVAFTLSGVVTADSLIIRKDAAADSEKVGTVNSGTAVQITALKSDGTAVWGKITVDKTTGWIKLDYVSFEISGTITSDTSIFKSASSDSDEVAPLAKGSKVTAVELTLNGTEVWIKVTVGKDTGWIKLSLVNTAPETEEPEDKEAPEDTEEPETPAEETPGSGEEEPDPSEEDASETGSDIEDPGDGSDGEEGDDSVLWD